MPRVGRKPQTNKKPTVTNITCLACGETKKASEFPASTSVFNAGTGRVQYCRECCINMSCDDNGNINIEKLKLTLQKIDKPFLPDVLQSSYEESKNGGNITHPLRLYLKTINSLSQYKILGWSASISDTYGIVDEDIHNENITIKKIFSEEVLERWRDYPLEDIEILEDFYSKMQEDNRIESVQDKIYLKKLAVINLEQDKAAKRNDWGMFDKLGTMFSKFMQDSKLRAQDRSEADRMGGIRNFCNIYAEVEKDDFIPPWEYYKKIHGLSQDVLDHTIMHIENFTLRLNKHERMVNPPIDTPKAQKEEIDLEHSNNYINIQVNKEDEDVIDSVD